MMLGSGHNELCFYIKINVNLKALKNDGCPSGGNLGKDKPHSIVATNLKTRFISGMV